ncbi:MAG TPA: phospholipase D-like domain-containing protein [Gemmata sp.]|nr:phospholipase D-like domain-containing protein [Gemmata sp.]
MNPEALDQFLRQSLDDHKLSRGERSALADWLAKNVRTDQDRGLARHVAFAVARSAAADPAAAGLVDWLEDVMKVLVPNATPAAQTSGTPAAGEDQVFFAPGERCLQQIVHRFGQCRRTADVCVFTITDDRITRAILDAHRRGVKVRVISDNEKCHDPGSDVHRIRDAGVPVKLDNIYDRRDPGTTGHMHHKFVLFDGSRLLNGSYNWTRGAADCNFENVVDTADARLAAAFAAEFERLWNAF